MRNPRLRRRIGFPIVNGAALKNLHPVDLDALVALARGEADPLLRFQRLDAGPPERAGVHVDVPAAIIRHHEAEALLVVEKLDLAFCHRTAGSCIPVAKSAAEPVAAAKAILSPAETIPAMMTAAATETISAAAKTIAAAVTTPVAEITARAARRRLFRRTGVNAVDRNNL